MSPDPHSPGSEDPRNENPGLLGAAVREVTADIVDTARLRRAETATGLRRAWVNRPPLVRALAWLFLAGAVGTGAFTAAWPALLAERLPRPLDWAAVRALLERDARPGDAVAIEPSWAERAREVLPATVHVLAVPPLAGEDLPGVRRVWVVSLDGLPHQSTDVEAALSSRAAASAPARRLGELALSHHDLADPMLPLAFLPDQVGSLTVRLGEEPCPADGGGFRCASGEGVLRVERSMRDVDGFARPCLALGPLGPLPAPLVLRFQRVPVGRFVLGHAGVVGPAPRGARLSVSGLVDGEEAGAVELDLTGFAAFRLDTARFAGPAREVSIVLTAAGPIGEVCLDGMTLP